MPLAASDILLKLSTTAGASGNGQSGTPAGSLGKYASTTQLSGTPLNNLFDTVTGAENTSLESEYRCIFVHNNHSTLQALDSVVWIAGETAGGADITIGVDPTAASPVGATSAQAVQIVNENTAPAGVAFSKPLAAGSGLSLGNIPAGSVKAVWICRTTTNSAPKNNDGVVLGFQCATGE
jgi:hypothetical protein